MFKNIVRKQKIDKAEYPDYMRRIHVYLRGSAFCLCGWRRMRAREREIENTRTDPAGR